MTDHGQLSLLQLLVPNNAAALSIQEKEQNTATLSVASTAARPASSAIPLTRSGKTTTTSHTDGLNSDGSTAFIGNTNTFIARPNAPNRADLRRQELVKKNWTGRTAQAERQDEEEERHRTETTASSQAMFSLVSCRRASVLPLSAAMAGAAHGSRDDDGDGGHTTSFNVACNAAASAAAAVALEPAARQTSVFAMNLTSSSTASTPYSGRRSTPVRTPVPGDAEVEAEREGWRHPQMPTPPCQPHATLAGSDDFLDSVERHSQMASTCDTDNDNDNDGVAAARRVGDDVPVNDYISNLFTSFDLDLTAVERHTPSQVLHTNDSGFSSSQMSSACPSPSNLRKQASPKMRSTTMAPIANACQSTTSSTTTATQGGEGVRRFSVGLLPRPSFNDGSLRPSRMTFVPGEWLTNSPCAPHSTHSTKVSESKLSEDCSSALLCAPPTLKEDTVQVDSEKTEDAPPSITLSHPDANPLVGDSDGDNEAKSPYSETNSTLTGGSPDANTSTLHQRTSLLASDPLGLAHPAPAAAVSQWTTSHNESEGSTKKAPPLSTFRTPPFSVFTKNNVHAAAEAAACAGGCVALLLTPHSESLSPQGETPGAVSASLQLPTPARERAPRPDFSACSSVSDFVLLHDGAAPQQEGARIHEPGVSPNEGGEAHVPQSRCAAVRSTQRVWYAMFNGVSFALIFFWRNIRKSVPWVSRLLHTVQHVVLLPLRMATTLVNGEAEEEAQDSSHGSQHPCSSKTSAVAGTASKEEALRPSTELKLEPSSAVPLVSSQMQDRPAQRLLATPHTTFGDVMPVASSSFSEMLRLSISSSQSVRLEASNTEASRRARPSSVAEGLQQSLRETWNGAANAWFANGAQQEPRTALRSSARIWRAPSLDQSPLLPRLPLPSNTSRSSGQGGGDSSSNAARGNDPVLQLQLQPMTSSFSSHLSPAGSLATSFDAASGSGFFYRGATPPASSTLAAMAGNDSVCHRSPSVKRPVSLARLSSSVTSIVTATTQSALLDDGYREQLYYAFQHPPSCNIGDLSGCFAAYKAMVETSSNSHHVLNWRELSLLLLPEDYIDYCDLFPPYHFLTFPDFVEFVEVLSVRHRL
ncbi:hypothetical protein N2W54_007409 [Lotmaria passim]